jgi:hypothetical protein
MPKKEDARGVHPQSLRNLRPYKNLSDEEWLEKFPETLEQINKSAPFERDINRKLEEFSKDYDIEDLKFNDREQLRALCQAMLTLESLEQRLYLVRIKDDMTQVDIVMMDKLNNMMSSLRKDISKMMDDLKISRKIRKGEREETVLGEIARLKKAAADFYEKRMAYIFCKECKMLLATIWTNYPNDKKNRISLVCNRTLPTGLKCNTRTSVTTKELLKNRNRNIEGIVEF